MLSVYQQISHLECLTSFFLVDQNLNPRKKNKMGTNRQFFFKIYEKLCNAQKRETPSRCLKRPAKAVGGVKKATENA